MPPARRPTLRPVLDLEVLDMSTLPGEDALPVLDEAEPLFVYGDGPRRPRVRAARAARAQGVPACRGTQAGAWLLRSGR